MASKKISELPDFTPPLDPTAVTPVVQSGVTKKTLVQNLGPGILPMTTEFDTTTPSAPAVGLTLYTAAKAASGRVAWNGPSNVSTSVQSMLATNKIALWSAQGNSNGTHQAGGIGLIGRGSFVFGVPPVTRTVVANSTDILAAKRLGFVANTDLSLGRTGVHSGAMQYCLRDGFEYVCRFGRAAAGTTSNSSTFSIGMKATITTASLNSQDNSTASIVVRQDGQSVPFLYYNNGAGWYSKVGADLSNFPTTSVNDAIYEFRIFCAPNATQIDLRFENITTGVVETRVINTLLPAQDILFNPMIFLSLSKGIDLISMYVETDN